MKRTTIKVSGGILGFIIFCLVGIILVCGISVGLGVFVAWLWNVLAASFGWSTITWWQAAIICLLLQMVGRLLSRGKEE